MSKSRVRAAVPAAIAFFLLSSGCVLSVSNDLADLAASIDALVGEIQSVDPRNVDLLGDDDDLLDVELDDDAEFIDDIEDDLDFDDLEEIVLLGIENLTGFDLFIGFSIDQEFQGIFVLDGETVLLEYDCFDVFELLFEDDFEPETGVFVEEFDLLDSLFEVGIDFECGEALIVTFDLAEIVAVREPLTP